MIPPEREPARVGEMKIPPVHSVETKYWWWMNFLSEYMMTLLPWDRVLDRAR